MSKTRIVVVVEGGVVQNVISDNDVEVSLIDHDNLSEGGSITVGDFPVEVDRGEVDKFYADPDGYAG